MNLLTKICIEKLAREIKLSRHYKSNLSECQRLFRVGVSYVVGIEKIRFRFTGKLEVFLIFFPLFFWEHNLTKVNEDVLFGCPQLDMHLRFVLFACNLFHTHIASDLIPSSVDDTTFCCCCYCCSALLLFSPLRLILCCYCCSADSAVDDSSCSGLLA